MTCCRDPYGIHWSDACPWCDHVTPTSCSERKAGRLLQQHMTTAHTDRIEADAAYREAILAGRGEAAAASAYRVRINASLIGAD